MNSEKQYIDLFKAQRNVICGNSCDAMNAVRSEAFERFAAAGFPSQKNELYKYTDIDKAFAPDYGLNLRRVEFPINPYEAFRCNVPNMSTSLYFVENDAFYERALPHATLPQGVYVGSLMKAAAEMPQIVGKYYAAAADMKKDPIAVHVDTPIEEVVQTIEKYDLVAVPVVDSIGRLVGQITVDDVMDEVREQTERDYQLASGLSQDVETNDNVVRQTSARLPWLLIGMLGGIGNSMILGNFDTTFAAHPEMALYIPLIGGTGGNVGTQSSAIVVQGLANSSLDAKNTFKQVAKEAVVAVINATIISLLVYIYNFIRFGAAATVTYSVSISLFAVVMFASIFGTLVPMTLEKLKVDPAIATGPFISITNDIIGMMLYMGITVLLS